MDDYKTSSEEYDSDELDRYNNANPHGFVYSSMLNTYRKSRKERISQFRDERDYEAHRDKFKKKKEVKNIGKSERVH
jgi:hypothetical protein